MKAHEPSSEAHRPLVSSVNWQEVHNWDYKCSFIRADEEQ